MKKDDCIFCKRLLSGEMEIPPDWVEMKCVSCGVKWIRDVNGGWCREVSLFKHGLDAVQYMCANSKFFDEHPSADIHYTRRPHSINQPTGRGKFIGATSRNANAWPLRDSIRKQWPW